MFSGYKYIDCLQHLTIKDLVGQTVDSSAPDFDLAEPLYILLDILNESPTAALLIQKSIDYDFSLVIDEDLNFDQNGFDAYHAALIIPKIRKSDLKRNKDVGRLLMTLADGLRRALKSNQGHQARFDLKPLDYLLLNRIVAADIDAVMVQICWELRTAGHPSAWRQLLAGEKGDLAIVFSNILKSDPMGQFNGRALRAVFRHWFADCSRTDQIDRESLEFIEAGFCDMSAKHFGCQNTVGENELRKIQKNLPFPNYLQDINIRNSWFKGLKDPAVAAYYQQIIQDIQRGYYS